MGVQLNELQSGREQEETCCALVPYKMLNIFDPQSLSAALEEDLTKPVINRSCSAKVKDADAIIGAVGGE